VEFRVDTYYSGQHDEVEVPAIVRLVSQSPLACIVTCRPVLEGGHYGGSDMARISLFERLGTAAAPERAPRYLDCELATYGRSANLKQKVNLAVEHPGQLRSVSTGLILSTHNFQTRPPDLIRQIEGMLAEPACRVVKVAYFARSIRDNLELLDLAAELRREHGKQAVMLGMGPFGLMSRVLAPKFGALLTFAALRRDEQTAPGQPILRELTEDYRFRSIGERTKVYGVVGWPVEHSLSPLVHNACFEATGHDGVYLPLPVAGSYEAFKGTVLDFVEHASLDFGGCSVTVPHKEHLVQLAREMTEAGDTRWRLDRLSSASGAGNTLVVRRNSAGAASGLEVMNTDGPAFVDALTRAGGNLGGRTVAVLGAGGTARALAAALLLEGAKVLVVNRTVQRAEDLCADLRVALGQTLGAQLDIRVADAAALALHPALAAVVNCTTLGMRGPQQDQAALSAETLSHVAEVSPSCVVADCVYRPVRTRLLSDAASAGLRTLDGVAMFVEQAALQCAAWTDGPAPRGLFERSVREALGEAK
jgi:3-dehydroquinate dehydratase/shikimate dehydrogenase